MSKKKNVPKKSTAQSGSPKAASLPRWLSLTGMHTLLLALFAILLYIDTCGNKYALDDAIVITDNMFTQEGISGISGIFGNDTFYGFFKEEGKANLVSGGRYRPFTPAMFALEHQFFGENPWVGHLINVLLFALTVALLHRLMLRLLQPRFGKAQTAFTALAAALLFAAHPIHTEVVANIKGRDEIMALLGSLSALYCIFRAVTEKQYVLLLPAFLCFLVGLFSKENALAMVVVIPFALVWFAKIKPADLIAPLGILVVAAGLFIAVRAAVLGGMGLGDPPRELMNNPYLKLENGQWVDFTPGERLSTVVYTWGNYLRLLVFPHPLTHDYYPKHIYLMKAADPGVLLSILAYAGLAVLAFAGLAGRSLIAFSVWWFALTFAMVSNLFFAVGTNMSERLIYMPSVGFSLACAVLLWRLYNWKKVAGQQAAIFLLAGVTLLYALKTATRNLVWKDNYTLFTTDIQTSPNSAKLRNAVGGELITQSVGEKDEQKRTQMLQEAVGHLREAVNLHPDYKNAWLLLGNAFNYLKQYEESIAGYKHALDIDPGYQEAINNLGITYRDAGKFYGEVQHDLAKSIGYLEEAYKLRPDEYETVRLLGVAYGIGNNPRKAVEYFGIATKLQPQNADAWFNLGLAWHSAGDAAQGDAYIQKAKELDPTILDKRGEGEGGRG